MTFSHQTVLREAAVALLKPGPGKVIVDGTLGGGGHSEVLLEAGAAVLGIDQDPAALAAARERLARFGERFTSLEGNFRDLETLCAGRLPVDGVLLDLGASSPQLDQAERGFSFQQDGPLDMRMSQQGPTAAELVEGLDEAALARALDELGEERYAKAIARELKRSLPQRTLAAAEVVKRAVPRKAWPERIHVATRTFQALRLLVNDELGALDQVLEALPRVLGKGGVAAVISFHSLEDRRVKQAFRRLEGECTCPPGLPVCVCGRRGTFRVLTRRAVVPTDSEQQANPRARSSRLRAAEKTA